MKNLGSSDFLARELVYEDTDKGIKYLTQLLDI
jgi:hypothetical protein